MGESLLMRDIEATDRQTDQLVYELYGLTEEEIKRCSEVSSLLLTFSSWEQETRLPREIEATDRQIDQPVYELYGLTEDEITVEATTQGGKPRPGYELCRGLTRQR